MWRKPPKAVNEGIRALVAVITILLGFVVLRFITVGLPMAIRLAATAIGGIAHVAIPMSAIWSPKNRLERRYTEAIARQMGVKQAFIVRLNLLKGANPYGQDIGALTLENGCLVFHGIRTSFSIPRSQVRSRQAEKGEHAWGTKLLTRVGEQAIGIDLVEEGRKSTDPTIEAAFERFWKADSVGEFVPPPTDSPPSSWPRWNFPGSRHLVFWGVIYLFLIVQTFQQEKTDRVIQSNLALVFFGTLIAALSFEIFRILHLFRNTSHTLSSETTHFLTAASSISHDEPAEVRVRA